MGQIDRHETLTAQLQFLGQMASTETALFHQVAAGKYGLGITDMKTLSILSQEACMTAGQIAQRLSLTSGAVTNVIDRLVRKNLVKRQSDPKDRRKVIVTVVPDALEPINDVYRSIGEAFANLMGTYTEEELEFLIRYHQASIEITKREIAKLST